MYGSDPIGPRAPNSKRAPSAPGGRLDLEAILPVVTNQLPPAIEATRRYQTLQALVNCTRRSLLPDPHVKEEQRKEWATELRLLEAKGVR